MAEEILLALNVEDVARLAIWIGGRQLGALRQVQMKVLGRLLKVLKGKGRILL